VAYRSSLVSTTRLSGDSIIGSVRSFAGAASPETSFGKAVTTDPVRLAT